MIDYKVKAPKKLIDVALSLNEINEACNREKWRWCWRNTVYPKPGQYMKHFYGRVNLKPTRAKADFASIVEEIVLHLINSPTVTASIKIEADCLEGFDEATQRTIKENCNTLKFELSEFE